MDFEETLLKFGFHPASGRTPRGVQVLVAEPPHFLPTPSRPSQRMMTTMWQMSLISAQPRFHLSQGTGRGSRSDSGMTCPRVVGGASDSHGAELLGGWTVLWRVRRGGSFATATVSFAWFGGRGFKLLLRGCRWAFQRLHLHGSASLLDLCSSTTAHLVTRRFHQTARLPRRSTKRVHSIHGQGR